jgi:hypothetical protein
MGSPACVDDGSRQMIWMGRYHSVMSSRTGSIVDQRAMITVVNPPRPGSLAGPMVADMKDW